MPYKNISVNDKDYEFYDAIRRAVTEEKEIHITMPEIIKLGMTFYNQRRKFVPEKKR